MARTDTGRGEALSTAFPEVLEHETDTSNKHAKLAADNQRLDIEMLLTLLIARSTMNFLSNRIGCSAAKNHTL